MKTNWLSPAVGAPAQRILLRPRWPSQLGLRSPRVLQAGLDLAMIVVIAGGYLQLGHPDVMFHIVWVFLALHAFVFGLRSTLVRIGLATAALIGYAVFNRLGVLATELDLIEWPLMFVIALVVAVMADRVRTTSQRYAQLYRLAQDRLLTAQEAERSRLSLDLHDGVGQILSALAMTLEVAAQSRPGTDADRAALERARRLAAVATDETRNVALRLRPPRIERVGLAAAIGELARGTGLPVEVRGNAVTAIQIVEPDVAVGIYRVVQEALANVARHAKATAVVVDMSIEGAEFFVSVKDDGCGFDVNDVEGKGLGLAGIRERAAMAHGNVDISSAPGAGTTIVVRVPLAGLPAAGTPTAPPHREHHSEGA